MWKPTEVQTSQHKARFAFYWGESCHQPASACLVDCAFPVPWTVRPAQISADLRFCSQARLSAHQGDWGGVPCLSAWVTAREKCDRGWGGPGQDPPRLPSLVLCSPESCRVGPAELSDVCFWTSYNLPILMPSWGPKTPSLKWWGAKRLK